MQGKNHRKTLRKGDCAFKVHLQTIFCKIRIGCYTTYLYSNVLSDWVIGLFFFWGPGALLGQKKKEKERKIPVNTTHSHSVCENQYVFNCVLQLESLRPRTAT